MRSVVPGVLMPIGFLLWLPSVAFAEGRLNTACDEAFEALPSVRLIDMNEQKKASIRYHGGWARWVKATRQRWSSQVLRHFLTERLRDTGKKIKDFEEKLAMAKSLYEQHARVLNGVESYIYAAQHTVLQGKQATHGEVNAILERHQPVYEEAEKWQQQANWLTAMLGQLKFRERALEYMLRYLEGR